MWHKGSGIRDIGCFHVVVMKLLSLMEDCEDGMEGRTSGLSFHYRTVSLVSAGLTGITKGIDHDIKGTI